MVGAYVTKVVLFFLQTGVLDSCLRDILVTLIPKVEALKMISQFQSISLYNVSYKLITKID